MTLNPTRDLWNLRKSKVLKRNLAWNLSKSMSNTWNQVKTKETLYKAVILINKNFCLKIVDYGKEVMHKLYIIHKRRKPTLGKYEWRL